MKLSTAKSTFTKVIIRSCHSCTKVVESHKEVERCPHCGKSFLPLNYFTKVKGCENQKYEEMFAESYELEEADLIKGIYVLW